MATDGFITQTAKNVVAPVADDGGGVIGGTFITATQEVLYSKLIRKFLKGVDRGWMELYLFSIITAGTDAGLGAYMDPRQSANVVEWSTALMETVRPLLSVILCNYIIRVGNLGLHNPIKSFGFKELLVQLAAKEFAYLGNGVLSKNIDMMRNHIKKYESLQRRQHDASRLRK